MYASTSNAIDNANVSWSWLLPENSTQKIIIIFLANTIIQPFTIVIKLHHAFITASCYCLHSILYTKLMSTVEIKLVRMVNSSDKMLLSRLVICFDAWSTDGSMHSMRLRIQFHDQCWSLLAKRLAITNTFLMRIHSCK
jgi:hypothetical protein